MSRTRVFGLSMLVMVVVAGCGMLSRGGKPQDRFVRPATPRISPSGDFEASVEESANEGGVKTWTIVIKDKNGAEVFRDGYAYSTRHAVAVTWLSSKDQLWILSSDVGTAHVDADSDGSWAKVSITPQTRGDIPAEIAELK